MHILSVKKICSCYNHLLNDWNCFWNKYHNMPFLAICRSVLYHLIFLPSSWHREAKIGLQMSRRYKRWLIIILNDFIKQPTAKQSPIFLSFSFLIACCISVFFSFLIKAFANFEKLIIFHWQAFIVYKNGENLKMLIEIFCQKHIVSNVILAFLDHLKPKILLVGQPQWPT